jgi:hypothetical protein
MSNDGSQKKRIGVNWGELMLPLLFLAVCVAYFIQAMGVSFDNLVFPLFVAVFIIPALAALIVQSVTKKQDSDVSEESSSVSLRSIRTKVLSALNSNPIRVSLIFVFCYGIINYLFGFTVFIFSFSFLTLLALGTSNRWVLVVLPLGLSLLIYFVFIRLCYVPLPKGIVGIF